MALCSFPKRPLTLWCDVFDTPARQHGTQGWLQLLLPGSPAVDAFQLPTMTQRLRKAQELAAANHSSKHDLVLAVLLSLDSQPMIDHHAILGGIALEACCRVLLPEAEQVELDLSAAKAAFQRLSQQEQQLWRQLQEMRLDLIRQGRSVSCLPLGPSADPLQWFLITS
jgi:hypothetical protein